MTTSQHHATTCTCVIIQFPLPQFIIPIACFLCSQPKWSIERTQLRLKHETYSIMVPTSDLSVHRNLLSSFSHYCSYSSGRRSSMAWVLFSFSFFHFVFRRRNITNHRISETVHQSQKDLTVEKCTWRRFILQGCVAVYFRQDFCDIFVVVKSIEFGLRSANI